MNRLKNFFLFHSHRPKISIIVPFGSKDPHRNRVARWNIKYWTDEIPDSEIIIGRSHSKPFSKTEAFNNGLERALGDVFVLLDADAYMDGEVISAAADRILEELKEGEHLWYVPYRRLWRLNQRVTEQILDSNPKNPLRIVDPPPPEDIDGSYTHSTYGKRYAAMVMVIPREAYETLGGFDERFKGWGGEDASILRALDTLWGKHKTTNNAVFHLWHPQIGKTYRDRMWEGQHHRHPNDHLAQRYHKANKHPKQMRELVDEGINARDKDTKKKVLKLFISSSKKIK